jgi:signal transduction histidine kinase
MRTRPGEIRETQMILRGVAQMKMLVDDLVEYTRDRLATGAKIEREKIQLDVFVKDLLAEINSIHPDRKISFVAQGSGQGDWDKARLRQLVTNLVGNALKFSERESAIAVSLDGSADDAIALAVQSCGPPVPGALLPAFFEPSPGPRGAEVPVHRRGVNAGLGLHIAREIVAAHGGTITLASGDKTGTRFEVLLPRSSSPSARDR